MEGCHGSVAVDGGLPGERQAVVGIAVVHTDIQEVIPRQRIPPVGGIGGLRLHPAVETGIDRIETHGGMALQQRTLSGQPHP